MSENHTEQHNDIDIMDSWLADQGPAPEPSLDALDTLWASGPPAGALQHMRGALDEWWEEQHPTVFYDWLDAPIGKVYLAVSRRGMVSVDFGYDGEADFRRHLQASHFPKKPIRMVHDRQQTAQAMRQIRQYFAGERDQFDLPVDLSALTDFQRRVLEAANQIPHGKIATYKEIASKIGQPGASRAVGNALGRNPIPIVIPCHRVLPQSGALGGYSGSGGPQTKARLLQIEGVLPGQSGRYVTA